MGILGGDFSEKKYGGESQWSIINRFDTNYSVHNEIQKIWMEETEGLEDFKTWIKNHAYDLFSNDGMYTERLVNINKNIIEVGHQNEDYAKRLIREHYGLKLEDEGIEYELYEHCSGDVNDRKKGQDLVLKIKGGETIYFQVKPFDFNQVVLYDGGDRGYYFVVPSSFPSNKYKSENVDVLVFVDRANEKFMMFRNDPGRVLTLNNPKYAPKYLIYFYELPIKSNFKVPLTQEPIRTPIKQTISRDKEKEIKYYKDRIKYFQDKIKQLGGSEELTNMVENYKRELSKIII